MQRSSGKGKPHLWWITQSPASSDPAQSPPSFSPFSSRCLPMGMGPIKLPRFLNSFSRKNAASETLNMVEKTLILYGLKWPWKHGEKTMKKPWKTHHPWWSVGSHLFQLLENGRMGFMMMHIYYLYIISLYIYYLYRSTYSIMGQNDSQY